MLQQLHALFFLLKFAYWYFKQFVFAVFEQWNLRRGKSYGLTDMAAEVVCHHSTLMDTFSAVDLPIRCLCCV